MDSRREIYEPDEIEQLGLVFDATWMRIASADLTVTVADRHKLAAILLGLADLRQLGPEQMQSTALRLYLGRCEQPLRTA
jgi:hypothetical protein